LPPRRVPWLHREEINPLLQRIPFGQLAVESLFTGYLVGLSKLTGEYVGLLIVEVLHNSRSAGPTIKPFFATRTDWQLDKWEEETIYYEKIIDICREDDIWPMMEKSCPFCKFRSVCKMGTEQAQASRLQQEFAQRTWDYKSLGEDIA